MRKALLAITLSLFALASPAGELIEGIVARVGDRIITVSDYRTRRAEEINQIRASVPPEVAESRIRQMEEGLLDEMINELLLQDRADQLDLLISDNEVDAAVEQLKEQYGLPDDAAFEASLRESGLTRIEMEERLRATLLQNRLFGLELRSRSQLSDRELKRRYERDRERYRLPERAEVREIVLLIPEGSDEATRAELNRRAAEVYERALAGEDFEVLVSEYSEAPSRDRGGRIGTIARGELLPELDTGVFRSDAGAVLGPIQTRFGYHILTVDQRLPSEIPAFDEIKDRLREEQSAEAFQADLEAYLEKLRNQAYVQINEDLI